MMTARTLNPFVSHADFMPQQPPYQHQQQQHGFAWSSTNMNVPAVNSARFVPFDDALFGVTTPTLNSAMGSTENDSVTVFDMLTSLNSNNNHGAMMMSSSGGAANGHNSNNNGSINNNEMIITDSDVDSLFMPYSTVWTSLLGDDSVTKTSNPFAK
jgi:hypothetical protein